MTWENRCKFEINGRNILSLAWNGEWKKPALMMIAIAHYWISLTRNAFGASSSSTPLLVSSKRFSSSSAFLLQRKTSFVVGRSHRRVIQDRVSLLLLLLLQLWSCEGARVRSKSARARLLHTCLYFTLRLAAAVRSLVGLASLSTEHSICTVRVVKNSILF